jgi:hypothetical protein
MLKLKLVIDLGEPTADLALVTWLDVTIFDDPGTGAETTVGEARVAVLHVREALERGESITEALDADLDVLHELYVQDGAPPGELDHRVDLLYVDGLSLEPAWRGRGFEQAAVRRLCETVGTSSALAVVPYGSAGEAAPWLRIGFTVTRPPSRERCGYLAMRLGRMNPLSATAS